jgi:curved DNA-binding protein CbpA
VSNPYRVLQVLPEAEPEVITAAYHALARKYHPDRDSSSHAARRMREVNAAYAVLRDPAARARLQRQKRMVEYTVAASTPRGTGSRANEPEATRLSFGRYVGRTLNEIARHDPDYLRWLSRHSSGVGLRNEINRILSGIGVPAA